MGIKKKLGVLGSLGSNSDLPFLKKLIDYSPAEKDQDFLEIIFQNNTKVFDPGSVLFEGNEHYLSYILNCIRIFNLNGVDVVVLSTIFNYHFYTDISQATPARIINPFQIISERLKINFKVKVKASLLLSKELLNIRVFQRELNTAYFEIVELNKEDHEELIKIFTIYSNDSATLTRGSAKVIKNYLEQLNQAGITILIGEISMQYFQPDLDKYSINYINILEELAKATVKSCYNVPNVILS